MGVKIVSISRKTGVAGQVEYTALVQYPGEKPEAHRFVGTTYSGGTGPIVAISPTGTQVFVTDPGRFGAAFDAAWVRAYYAPRRA